MPDISVEGPGGSSVVQSPQGQRVRIGRGSENELVLRDSEVSRLHAELRREDGTWYVLDHGSRNGTELRGRAVKSARLVRPGEAIRIGPFTLRLLAESAGAEGQSDTTAEAGGSAAAGVTAGEGAPRLVGESSGMVRVRDFVGRVAALDTPVLVTGESGTGKELVAALLHRHSARAAASFVVVNCPSLPASLADAELFGVERGVATGVEARMGRLELADGGTLFLDEVGDLDLSVQAKLLRFLEDGSLDGVGSRCVRRVDVRVVSATNQDLEKAVEEGSFRSDLFHRLAAVRVHVPPLRERREDVPLLVAHVLEGLDAADLEVDADAMRCLASHPFPGNVRQLQHAVRLAHALSKDGRITLDDLPDDLRAPPPVDEGPTAEALLLAIVDEGRSFWDVVKAPFMRRELSRDDVERLVRLARERAGGSYRDMAALLGIDGEYRQLINFLSYHGIDRGGRRRSPGAGGDGESSPSS